MLTDYTQYKLELHKYYSICHEFTREVKTSIFILEFDSVVETKFYRFNRYKVLREGKVDYIDLTAWNIVQFKEIVDIVQKCVV